MNRKRHDVARDFPSNAAYPCAGANSRPAPPFRCGAAVPERVVWAGVPVGRLWLSGGIGL